MNPRLPVDETDYEKALQATVLSPDDLGIGVRRLREGITELGENLGFWLTAVERLKRPHEIVDVCIGIRLHREGGAREANGGEALSREVRVGLCNEIGGTSNDEPEPFLNARSEVKKLLIPSDEEVSTTERGQDEVPAIRPVSLRLGGTEDTGELPLELPGEVVIGVGKGAKA